MTGFARSIFQLAYGSSPIILTGGGLAEGIPGGMLPIVALTNAISFTTGLLSGGSDVGNLDSYFASFVPLTDSSLVEYDVGHYPFANQAVAANAVIAQPLKVSMKMICPARGDFGYTSKLATLTALKASLDQHSQNGGTYTVATPSYIYTNCLLISVRDISNSQSNQAQTEWKFDFEQPLLTLQQANEAQGALMSKLTSGVPIVGQPAWSGLISTLGIPPSLATLGLVPSISGAGGGIASSP